MAREQLYDYRKPGFPKTTNSEKSYKTTIEYVGPSTTLASFEPANGTVWGDFDGVVSNTTLSPIEGTSKSELTVDVEFFYDGAEGSAGTLREISFEVEWVSFERSMLEHPAFRLDGGGTYELDEEDIAAIERWKNQENLEFKKDYIYEGDTSPQDLSTAAAMFAKGINLGIETYEDFAPVIRKTSTYVGGNPGESTAGEKESPPTFSGKPDGYEWRKSADRAVKSGGQSRWDRVEEWVGADTVLTDKNAVYWTAPT